MANISATIDLSSTRVITGIVPLDKLFTVDMKSTDLSADTDWTLKMGFDKDDLANANNDSGDITGTLSSGTKQTRTFAGDPGLYWEIEFGGATTGSVAYTKTV